VTAVLLNPGAPVVASRTPAFRFNPNAVINNTCFMCLFRLLFARAERAHKAFGVHARTDLFSATLAYDYSTARNKTSPEVISMFFDMQIRRGVDQTTRSGRNVTAAAAAAE